MASDFHMQVGKGTFRGAVSFILCGEGAPYVVDPYHLVSFKTRIKGDLDNVKTAFFAAWLALCEIAFCRSDDVPLLFAISSMIASMSSGVAFANFLFSIIAPPPYLSRLISQGT